MKRYITLFAIAIFITGCGKKQMDDAFAEKPTIDVSTTCIDGRWKDFFQSLESEPLKRPLNENEIITLDRINRFECTKSVL